jgi:LysM repeat protein
MNKRSSAPARVLAVTALVIAFVVAIVAISASLGGDDSNDSGTSKRGGKAAAHKTQPKQVPATYEVKSGDTLIAIAHRMGISVAQIEELNPEVDPQILVAGEQLKLR